MARRRTNTPFNMPTGHRVATPEGSMDAAAPSASSRWDAGPDMIVASAQGAHHVDVAEDLHSGRVPSRG